MNKKIVIPTLFAPLIFFLFFIVPLYVTTHYEPFHIDGELSQSAKDIFAKLHEQVTTLKDANSYAQKNLIRKGERWDKQPESSLHELMEENRSYIVVDLRTLGMIDEIKPAKKHYTYAGLMGALEERVTDRMNYLQELILAGYTFDY